MFYLQELERMKHRHGNYQIAPQDPDATSGGVTTTETYETSQVEEQNCISYNMS